MIKKPQRRRGRRERGRINNSDTNGFDMIDEFWLTICPLILGGSTAPTPVEGSGFFFELAPRLQLLEVHTVESEVFVHYRLQRPTD